MGDLAVAGTVADADHDQPGPLDADEGGVHAGAVGHEHRDPLAVGRWPAASRARAMPSAVGVVVAPT